MILVALSMIVWVFCYCHEWGVWLYSVCTIWYLHASLCKVSISIWQLYCGLCPFPFFSCMMLLYLPLYYSIPLRMELVFCFSEIQVNLLLTQYYFSRPMICKIILSFVGSDVLVRYWQILQLWTGIVSLLVIYVLLFYVACMFCVTCRS